MILVFITALLFLKDLLLNESMILFIAGFTLIRRVLSGTRMKVGLALLSMVLLLQQYFYLAMNLFLAVTDQRAFLVLNIFLRDLY